MRGAEKVGGGDLSPQAFEFSHEMRLQLVLVFSSVVRLEDSVKKKHGSGLGWGLRRHGQPQFTPSLGLGDFIFGCNIGLCPRAHVLGVPHHTDKFPFLGTDVRCNSRHYAVSDGEWNIVPI